MVDPKRKERNKWVLNLMTIIMNLPNQNHQLQS